MTTETTIETISITELPALKAELAGGFYAGAITLTDGTLVAVVTDMKRATGLTWEKALELAKEKGCTLPTKAIGALIAANFKGLVESGWYWTCEADEDDEDGDKYAWTFTSYGGCYDFHTYYEGSALFVRLIPIKP